jgi:hypothetical protein
MKLLKNIFDRNTDAKKPEDIEKEAKKMEEMERKLKAAEETAQKAKEEAACATRKAERAMWNGGGPTFAKPNIYLYPEKERKTSVDLSLDGEIVSVYPSFHRTMVKKGSWTVIARPDGTLVVDGHEYSYLFWEGVPEKPVDWDLSTGFVVKGSDTREFLQQKLREIGLIPKEYNEFIVYWYPRMKDSPYNLIHFVGMQYTDIAKLVITPTPDAILRVFMVFKPLAEAIDIAPQIFSPFERKGFTVVEWGGAESSKNLIR